MLNIESDKPCNTHILFSGVSEHFHCHQPHQSFVMGYDLYENLEKFERDPTSSIPPLGIGKNCKITNAIIDKNARIGDNVQLSPEGKPDGFECGDVYVKDGILVVGKNGIIPDNTII